MKTKLAFKSQEGKAAIVTFYEGLLAQWPFPHEELHVPTRYGDTFVIACGENDHPPLILLHGSAFNSLMWLGDVMEYAKRYRVFLVDIPGEAGKTDEHQLPLKSAAYGEWLHDVFHALAIEKAGIIGISLGAWLAIKFTVGFPEMVSKLVLLCPGGVGGQKISFLITTFAHRIFKRGTKKLYNNVNNNHEMPDVVTQFQMLIDAHFNYHRERIPMFSDRELQRLAMPVALFVGQKDVIFHSDKTANRMKRVLPHAKITVLPEAGHLLLGLTDKISAFLNG